jgi:hypothetical protein
VARHTGDPAPQVRILWRVEVHHAGTEDQEGTIRPCIRSCGVLLHQSLEVYLWTDFAYRQCCLLTLFVYRPAQSHISPHILPNLRYHTSSYHPGFVTAMARPSRQHRLRDRSWSQAGVDTALLVSYTRAAFPGQMLSAAPGKEAEE